MAIADDFAAIQKRRLELGHEAWPSKPVENIIPHTLQPYFWGSFPAAFGKAISEAAIHDAVARSMALFPSITYLEDDEIHIERVQIYGGPFPVEQVSLGTFASTTEMSREEFTKRFPCYTSNYAVLDPDSQKLKPCSEQEYLKAVAREA